MKKRKLKKVTGLILVLLIIVSSTTSCLMPKKSSGLVGGALLDADNGSDEGESHPVHLAFKSETNRFDIDNVTLEFFYGGVWGDIEETLQGSYNYPYFEIGFENDEGQRIIVKKMQENLVSEKYKYVIMYDRNEDGAYYISEKRFNFSEELTIPKELFTKDCGSIIFAIYGENIAPGCSNGLSMIQFLHIYYQVDPSTEKVTLSNEGKESKL